VNEVWCARSGIVARRHARGRVRSRRARSGGWRVAAAGGVAGPAVPAGADLPAGLPDRDRGLRVHRRRERPADRGASKQSSARLRARCSPPGPAASRCAGRSTPACYDTSTATGPFPASLITTVISQPSSRRLGTILRRTARRARPSSLTQHRLKKLSLHQAPLNVRDTRGSRLGLRITLRLPGYLAALSSASMSIRRS
jgi:hypothetical protein